MSLQTSWPPIPLLDLKTQYGTIRDEVRAAIDRLVESQHFILGPEVEAFEDEIAKYCGARTPSGFPRDPTLCSSLSEFPMSENAARESLALPIYAELTDDMQRRIVDTIGEWQQRA